MRWKPTAWRLFGALLLPLLLWGLASEAVAQRPGPSLVLGGDVLYDAPLSYQLRRRTREVGREQALREVFIDLSPSLSRADLALINLEVPISPRYRERGERAVFQAPEDFLDALVAAGVDAVNIANNHAYDQGVRGLENTLAATRARSVPTIGAGRTPTDAARAVILNAGGARVAVACWTEGTNYRPTHDEFVAGPRIAFVRDETITQSLREARTRADLVIAMFHWTQEDLTVPRPVMRQLARQAAEAGADLVIGHGTHVPGRRERIRTSDGREVPVLYSLGNLIAAMDEPAGSLLSSEVGVRDAPLAELTTEWRQGHLRISGIHVRHHWIARPVGNAPWMEGGRLAVLRPVAIEAELARLGAANCGELCALRADAYRRRVTLIDRAMSEVSGVHGRPLPPLVAQHPAQPPVLAAAPTPLASPRITARPNVATRPTAPAQAPPTLAPPIPVPMRPAIAARPTPPTPATAPSIATVAARAVAARPATPSQPTVASRPTVPARPAPTVRPAIATRPSAPTSPAARPTPTARPSTPSRPPPRAHRPVIADSDPRLAPYLRGVVLPVTFDPGQAVERSADAAHIARAVALLQEDRGLRVTVIAYSTAQEEAASPGLASRRARRVRGLIAMRGPSRSRFSSRGGPPGGGPRAGTSHVVVRFSR